MLAALAWIAGGCASSPDDDYRRANEMPPLVVPADLKPLENKDLMPLPPRADAPAVVAVDGIPRPKPLDLNVNENEVRIQNIGADYWVLLTVPPSETWPRVQSFLVRQGVPTQTGDARAGIIETGLVQLSDDTGLWHQYRIAIKQGVQRNTTEIAIRQRQFDTEPTDAGQLPPWGDAPSQSQDAEAWLRDTMASALADTLADSTISLLSRDMESQSRAQLVDDSEEQPFLHLDLPWRRGWASVSYALGSAGIEAQSQDSDAGYFIINHSMSVRGGLFGRTRTRTVQYQLHLTNRGDEGLELRVNQMDGQPLEREQAVAILTLISSHLT